MNIIPLKIEGRYFLQMIKLYSTIFGGDPGGMKKQFLRHSQYPNFEGYLAIKDDRVVGYIYGYTSISGQYYHDLLKKHLSSNSEWLKDCMELVELGVHPKYRRQGIAKMLMDVLLQNRQEQTALLTVRKDNHRAISLYKKIGWVAIRDGFYPNVPDEYIIMGKEVGNY